MDPVFGFNPRGRNVCPREEKESMMRGQSQTAIDHDLEDEEIENREASTIGGCQGASRPVTMKILSWNIRGLGNPQAVRRLRHSLKLHNPQVVFFMETKINKFKMEKVRQSCGYQFGIDVESSGSRGGLSLAWRWDVDIVLQSFSHRHIDVIINEDEGKK
ncbi:BEACH domain-containing lvsC [Gossypium australe]|uniref:BEACH domain-containing lvsC n=1 Tax=Gossypium australe TaxID=47621 RepID=A0A5B6UWJ1_9ROSI|nr:BEACH domain-containing lvsC [Gossypium australe]